MAFILCCTPFFFFAFLKWGTTPELLNNTKVNDEYLFRNLARKMEKRTKNSCKTKSLCNAH
jgi:hypothetical protein